MTTNHKIKKAVARRERIRKEKASRKISNAVGRKAAKTEWSLFKDTTQFFNTVLNDYGNLVYRKEQIKAGIVGEIKRITDLKNEDPEKYEKLNTKVYDDCLAELDNDVQSKLKSLAQLVDKFKDNPAAGADRLTSALDASQMLSGIVTSLGDVVNKAESYYTTVKDTIEGIEHHETNPIAEEAKNQTETDPDYNPAEVTDSADRTPETQQLHDVTIEADADALNKIIGAQADSKSDVVVNPLDVIKKTQLIPLTVNDSEGVLLRDGIIKTNASANLFTLSSSDVSDSSHKVDDSVKLHSVVVELSLDNDKELFELQIDQLKDAALISKPKNVVTITANARGTFVEYEFDLTKNVKKLDGSDSVILGKLADDESIHSKLAFSAQINLDDSNIRGYGFVSFASHTDFQANVVGYTVDAYCAPALALNKPEINMTDTNQNTAASGNTFDDQEVDIVATPAAAKGNTNADQETSVDADTVNKILNEQNGSSAS